MKKWKVVALVLIIALFIANLYWWQAWQAWQTEEEALQGRVEFYQQELKASETELDDAVSQVFLLVDELQGVREELKNQKVYYDNKLLEEIKLAEEAGYQKALARAVPSRNPTYYEAMKLAYGVDYWTVSQQKRQAGKSFVCVDFAEALDNAADRVGIRCGLAFLVYTDDGQSKWGHFINYFDTIDEGRIYFDAMLGIETTYMVAEKSYCKNFVKEIIYYP